MKKVMVWLLLACMLLTLASCGSDEESTETSEAKDRVFHGKVEGTEVWVTVRDGVFTLESVNMDNPRGSGSITIDGNGVYYLDTYLIGGFRVTPWKDDYKKSTMVNENEQYGDIMEKERVLKISADNRYTMYDYSVQGFSYSTEGERKIVTLSTAYGETAEMWVEGTMATGYAKAVGTYNLRDRGETKLIDLSFSWGGNDVTTGSGTLTGDKLTLTMDGENVSMSRMSDNVYFGQFDGQETILRLKADGVAELLMADETDAGSITCEPGKSLEMKMDDRVLLGFSIEGETLRMYGDGLDVAVILNEVK